MSTYVSRSSSCKLSGCNQKAVFDVGHPERGMIEVCEYHAQSIEAEFGDVEVSL